MTNLHENKAVNRSGRANRGETFDLLEDSLKNAPQRQSPPFATNTIMKEYTCYLVGQFREAGGVVQLSFFPAHPERHQVSATGLWKGEGLHGDGKYLTPHQALSMNYHHLPVGAASASDDLEISNGLEFLCREAGCMWFLDFVQRLVDGAAEPGDFLAEFRRHNNGAEPRSDAKYYVFL